MSGKSPICRGRKTGRPLTEYDSEQEALEGAEYARRRYGNEMVPYRCETCGKWHLSPADRRTPSYPCPYCRGADGKSKESYLTEEDARRRARILRREQSARLRVYPCPHGQGWHLTRG